MRIYPFNALYPNTDQIPSLENFFDTVNGNFPEFLQAGLFSEDPDEAVFIYQILGRKRNFTGLFTCLGMEDYLNGYIVRHEFTVSDKVTWMKKLLERRDAMIKPILLTYKPQDVIDQLFDRVIESDEPWQIIDFESDNEKHHIYKVADKDLIKSINGAFERNITKVYIADGHHRCEAGIQLYEQIESEENNKDYSKLLCALFPFDQINIEDYNRVVEIPDEISPAQLLEKLSDVCEVSLLKKPSKPATKHEITMYLNNKWYRLRWKKSILKKYDHMKILLDALVLNSEIIQQIFMIEDIRTDARIRYAHGFAGIKDLIDKSDKGMYSVGFFLFPIAIEEVTEICDSGQTLPPKSTWFEPRIKNGVLSKRY